MKISGSELIVRALRQEGVEVLFGFPGGSVIPFFDALYKAPDLRVVLTRHEQGAVHAADGYARSTGRVGVCVATSGPGATNTITGLATANYDSVPLVCLTGQVPRHMIGNDAFQEADTVGISRPVTKHNYLVTSRADLPRILKEAFTLAAGGRPGPVLVDIPKDVFTEQGDDAYPQSVTIRGFHPVLRGAPGRIRQAAEALNGAQRPLFYLGGGVHIAGAVEVLRRIRQKTGVPAVCSLMGIGALPRRDPLNLGMLGMHGTYAANMAVTDCDLLFAVGARFDDRATGDLAKFAPKARIVHVDIDPAAIAQNIPVALSIVGDARLVLEDLEPLLEPARIGAWLERIAGWQAERPLLPSPGGQLLPRRGSSSPIAETFPEAIVTTEVGQNQMWAAHFYTSTPARTFLTSGGLGTMGYGFPAAIGAQLGNPGRRVIDIAGDGSIQMNIQELATAVVEEPAGDRGHPEQRLPGDGAPVAGDVLRAALFLHLPGPRAGLPPGVQRAGRPLSPLHPRLRQAGGGLRGGGDARRPPRGGGAGAGGGGPLEEAARCSSISWWSGKPTSGPWCPPGAGIGEMMFAPETAEGRVGK